MTCASNWYPKRMRAFCRPKGRAATADVRMATPDYELACQETGASSPRRKLEHRRSRARACVRGRTRVRHDASAAGKSGAFCVNSALHAGCSRRGDDRAKALGDSREHSDASLHHHRVDSDSELVGACRGERDHVTGSISLAPVAGTPGEPPRADVVPDRRDVANAVADERSHVRATRSRNGVHTNPARWTGHQSLPHATDAFGYRDLLVSSDWAR